MALRLIVSPAKKMLVGDDFACEGEPRFLGRAQELTAALRRLSREELQGVWAASDALTAKSLADLDAWQPAGPAATPAVMSYHGIQYQRLAPSVMSDGELAWLQGHLRILSGLYGVLRPFDGVEPYRLEMQAKLQVGSAKNLYEYWGSSLAGALAEELRAEAAPGEGLWVANLASKEYARAVTPHLPGDVGLVTCLFGQEEAREEQPPRLRQRATQAKAARGLFVRWCAERGARGPEDFGAFDEAGYRLNEALSSEGTLVFTL